MARPPVRERPRLSAAQLADYLASTSPVAQMGILRSAKFPGDARPLIIQYQLARGPISASLQDRPALNNIIASSVAQLEQRRDDPANRPLVRDDARRCIEVLQTFQRSVNALDLQAATFSPAPLRSSPLVIGGVEISVAADAVATVPYRGANRIGQVFIRCTMGQDSDSAEGRRSEANGHLAVIAHMHTVQTLMEVGTAHAPASMVIDVPRSRVVRGPSSTTMRVRQIETACAMIAAIWPTVRPPGA